MRLPTVTIVTDNGPVIINKSDFDPAIHTLHDAGEAAVEPAPSVIPSIPVEPTSAPVQPPAPVTPPPPPVPPVQPDDKPLVAQIGDRYFIVNVKGEKLAGKGISPTGYASNEKAWEAVTKLSE